MKKYLLFIILFISSIISVNFCYAQGVAVNTDGSTADPSAMLDVKSSNQGILIPRVASTASITSPVTGLLIFQTTAPVGFYYYDGATWDYLQNSANANVTLQGNSFNAANNLLKLDASGKVPLANLGTSGTPSAGTYLNGNDAWVPVPAGLTNGTSAGQIYITGGSPFAPQAPQTVTGDVSLTSTAVTSYNNVVPANKGGAGAINGILSANGSGTVSAASTTGSGSIVLATSPTLVTPNLGTIASGNGAALTGLQNIANNSTAGNSIVTALGSATFGTTGSGNIVLASSPTLVAPSLGTPSALVGTNISGTAANLTAGNVTTDANLTGDVTSVGNTTSINTTAAAGNHIVTAINAGTGIIAASRLGTGATPTNFLRGDGTFATPAGAGSGITYGGTLTNGNTISVTTPTFYLVTDGASITLPAATTAGQMLYLVNTNISTTNVGFTVNRQGGNTIYNAQLSTPVVTHSPASGSSYVLYDSATLISDGAGNWYILVNN